MQDVSKGDERPDGAKRRVRWEVPTELEFNLNLEVQVCQEAGEEEILNQYPALPTPRGFHFTAKTLTESNFERTVGPIGRNQGTNLKKI